MLPTQDKEAIRKVAEEYYKSLFNGEIFKYETEANCLRVAKVFLKITEELGYQRLLPITGGQCT